jgi:cytochrome c-type biogenesis protein CcmE
MTPRKKRFWFITVGIAVLCIAAAFVLNAFQSNLVFFFTPSQVAKGEAPRNRLFRIGGMVREGSLKKGSDEIEFVVTDFTNEVSVHYTGLLPDLFKEGKGVVAQGRLNDQGIFQATEVLAKHDENYMPPEAKSAMDKAALERAAKSLKPNPNETQ